MKGEICRETIVSSGSGAPVFIQVSKHTMNEQWYCKSQSQYLIVQNVTEAITVIDCPGPGKKSMICTLLAIQIPIPRFNA